MAAPALIPAERRFWHVLPETDQAAFLRRGITRRFARGQSLMLEYQPGERVLLLREGRVKVASISPVTGREVLLAIREPGELVGEQAAIDDEPRSAAVIALEPGEAVAIARADFLSFLEGHPAAALAVMGALSRRLRDADAKRVEFAALGTLARVAGRLLELVERFGVTDDETTLIALPLSQEELAGWTGASIESVGRALQTMRTLEWIQTRRREIRILDVEALRRAVS